MKTVRIEQNYEVVIDEVIVHHDLHSLVVVEGDLGSFNETHDDNYIAFPCMPDESSFTRYGVFLGRPDRSPFVPEIVLSPEGDYVLIFRKDKDYVS
jgi:hypothetical protein